MECFDTNCTGTYARQELPDEGTYWYECTDCCTELNSQQFAEITRLRLLETEIVKPLLALLDSGEYIALLRVGEQTQWLKKPDAGLEYTTGKADTLPEALVAAIKAERIKS
jgi:hypothetical protein